MSHHLVNGVMDVSLPGIPKWVFCVVAHRAAVSTGEVLISTADLASVCGLSPSCVRDQLKRLARAGLVETKSPARSMHLIRVKLGAAQ
ncbi:Iron dependent repressor, N-terminal DNA binding domain [Burkholderia sp. YR290]|nr:Iron dependent repressor, N-terminal DNA binding domain [Burkholderia sp. YR290]